jgi:hypothetical protein
MQRVNEESISLDDEHVGQLIRSGYPCASAHLGWRRPRAKHSRSNHLVGDAMSSQRVAVQYSTIPYSAPNTVMAVPSFKILSWLSTLLLFAAILQSCTAHRIDVEPGKKECFFEDLHHEDQVSLDRFTLSLAC